MDYFSEARSARIPEALGQWLRWIRLKMRVTIWIKSHVHHVVLDLRVDVLLIMRGVRIGRIRILIVVVWRRLLGRRGHLVHLKAAHHGGGRIVVHSAVSSTLAIASELAIVLGLNGHIRHVWRVLKRILIDSQWATNQMTNWALWYFLVW